MTLYDDDPDEDVWGKYRYCIQYGRKVIKLLLHSSESRHSSVLSKKFAEEMEQREAADKKSLIELYAARVDYSTKQSLFS